MFFEEKLEQINNLINQINQKSKILIWGIGQHTDKLMKYTNLLSFPQLVFTGKEKVWGGGEIIRVPGGLHIRIKFG